MIEKGKTKNTHKDTKYKVEGRRIQNKIKHFIKHNIPINADEATAKKLINNFSELQSSRRKGK